MKEEGLIEKVKEGNLRAFRQIVEQYKGIVYTIAYDILKVHEDAEDVSQEVFLKVYHSIGTFRGESKFSSWIHRIAVNLSLNHRRKMNRRILDSMNEKVEETIDGGNNTYAETERLELSKKIENALNSLTEKQRTTFVLKHYHNLSLKEIADAMGCSVGTVKSQLFRALQKLQGLLEKYRIEL